LSPDNIQFRPDARAQKGKRNRHATSIDPSFAYSAGGHFGPGHTGPCERVGQLGRYLARRCFAQPGLRLLPTVLVAFIERPFVSLAGVDKRPLLRSIRANLLSLVVGIPVAGGIYADRSPQGLIGLAVVAVAITIVVEIAYLQSVLRKESRQLRWLWIVLGNIVSNLVLVGISLTVRMLNEDYPELGNVVQPYESLLMWTHFTISTTAVVAALAEPAMRLLRAPFAGGMKTEPSPMLAENTSGDASRSASEYAESLDGEGALPERR
jgi:hypothetical protein